MRVYLSGGMEYADDGGTGWREELQEWLEREYHADVFNPPVESDRYFKQHHAQEDMSALKGTDLEKFREIIRPLIDRDCLEVAEKADIVVCRWDEAAMRGAGTQGELTIARYFRKPVFLFTPLPIEAVPRWVLGCSTIVVSSFEELKNQLRVFFRSRHGNS